MMFWDHEMASRVGFHALWLASVAFAQQPATAPAKEYPEDHFAIGVRSMPAVFDFFDRIRGKQ